MEAAKIAELVVTGLTTIAAAFAGAWAAFRYSGRHEKARIREAQLEECNRAMLVLCRQYNWLLNYRAQILDPMRQDAGRHLFVLPSDPLDLKHWSVNSPAMSFLIQTAATEMPFMLGLVDEKFHAVIALINVRSNEHRDFQRALAESSLDQTSSHPLEAFQDAVGPRLPHTLKQLTDQIYERTDDTLVALEATGRDARNVMSTLFPGTRIFGFAPPSPADRAVQAAPPT